MQNTIKRVWNGATTVLIGLMMILAILLWGFRFMGYEVLVVQSGSMEPAYHVGSLVYVKQVDVQELKSGDVITFELGSGVRGTHRIVEVLGERDNISFRTKGDNNDYADANPIRPEAIVGQVKFTIPYLGYLVAYIQQPTGKFAAASVAAFVLLLTILPEIIFPDKTEKTKEEIMK